MIKFIVVHCSDTPDEMFVDAAMIHRWHLQNGWSGIGYNAVILRDGRIQNGRPDYWPGAHVRDFNKDGLGNNDDSLGICLIGRDNYSDNQMASLEGWIHAKLQKFPSAKIVGHRDLDSRKTCPNFDVKSWWKNVYNWS